MTKSIVFAEQFYYPEGWGGAQLPRDVTIRLAESGFDVRVICGSEQYAPIDGDTSLDPRQKGVRLLRLPRLLRGDIHKLKLLRQLWFYTTALPTMVFCQKPDLFVTQTNPPMVVPLSAVVASIRRVPLLIITQDLYPEVVLAHGMMRQGTFASRALSRLFSWSYRRADGVVALGTTMAERLQKKGVRPERIAVISNWSTGDEGVVRGPDNLLRRKWNLEGNFVVLYSGNLGIAHEVVPLLQALQIAVRSRPEIRLVFVGTGSRIPEAKALVDELGLNSFVQFHPLVAADLLPHSIGLADLALVTLREGFDGLVVPSKLLGYMSRGVPTLYIGPASDVTAILAQSLGGRCFTREQVEDLGEQLVQMASDAPSVAAMGVAARSYYARSLDREIALERYLELVNRLCDREAMTPSPRVAAQ